MFQVWGRLVLLQGVPKKKLEDKAQENVRKVHQNIGEVEWSERKAFSRSS
jgi:hypothetical protein